MTTPARPGHPGDLPFTRPIGTSDAGSGPSPGRPFATSPSSTPGPGTAPGSPVPPVRLSGPADLVGAIPWILGFHPRRSLVVVGMTGPRSEVGLTLRLDLPHDDGPGPDSGRDPARPAGGRGRRRTTASLAAAVATQVAESRADVAAVLVFADDAPASGPARPTPAAERHRQRDAGARIADRTEMPRPEVRAPGDRHQDHAADAAMAGALDRHDPRLPWAHLARAVRVALAEAGTIAAPALLVTGNAYRCLDCDADDCAPADVALPDRPTGELARLAAEAVAAGDQVLPDRDALRLSVQYDPTTAPPASTLRRLEAEQEAALLVDAGAWRTHTVPGVSDAVVRQTHGEDPADAETLLRIALALHDRDIRDRVCTWAGDAGPGLTDVLRRAARAVPDGLAAPVCATLAWVAYCGGDGALANVALDRALAVEPRYGLAVLLRRAAQAGVHPTALLDVGRDVAAELDRRSRAERSAA